MQQPNATQANALARNAGIDFLRGLSIVLVLLNHIGLRLRLTEGVLGAHLPRELLNDLNFNGSEAVYIFFVISGFLITSNALVRWGSLGAIELRGFYVRRVARILPCLAILVGVLSALHLLGVHDFVIHGRGQSLPGAVGSAFGLYLNWYEGHTGYLPANWDVLWSLSIEEVFYLGFPVDVHSVAQGVAAGAGHGSAGIVAAVFAGDNRGQPHLEREGLSARHGGNRDGSSGSARCEIS